MINLTSTTMDELTRRLGIIRSLGCSTDNALDGAVLDGSLTEDQATELKGRIK